MAINLDGEFGLYINSVTPSGPDNRTLAADIGGALWHVLEMHGTAGLVKDALDTDKPNQILAPIPVGAIRLFGLPLHTHKAYPVTGTDPGTPSDDLDSGLDTDLIPINILVSKSLPSYQVLKDWAQAFGGDFEPLPVRPT
jgi:hypothetical protein